MAGSIKWDHKDFDEGIKKLKQRVDDSLNKAVASVGLEILRLSNPQVPHDKGQLAGSGQYEPAGDGRGEVGYDKVYAARLHEHPEYHFQKGRKGKYLIDPIMQNLGVFQNVCGTIIGEVFR